MVPLGVPTPVSPHVTVQSAPTQFVTVQPVAGHVTWHWGLLAQSTLQLVALSHST